MKGESPRNRNHAEAVVYFVLCEELRRVKIGTSTDLAKRMNGLSASSPGMLTIVGSIRGSANVERWCQFHCFDARSHFEWFHWTPRVVAFVDLVLKHGDDAARVMCPAEARADGMATIGRRVRGRGAPQLPSEGYDRPPAVARHRAALYRVYAETVTPIGALCRCDGCAAYAAKSGGSDAHG